MNRTHLWSVIWLSALTFSTLSYQQCAPANFSSAQEATVSKAGGVGTGDGSGVSTGNNMSDDSGDSNSEPACISRTELKIEDQDGIPMAACPKEASEKCVVVCHVPPGNPAAAHTIMIGASALQAHLNHGRKAARSPAAAKVQCNHSDSNSSDLPTSDYLGECGSAPADIPPAENEVCQEP